MAKPASPSRSSATEEHFFEILKGFDTAVLVTLGEVERMHGRPMSVAGREDGGTLWFMTSVESPKVAEVLADRHALVVMQSSNRFIVIEGLAEIVRDRAKIEAVMATWDTMPVLGADRLPTPVGVSPPAS